MAKTGRGPFCEYFCKLTRMCKILKVFPSKCQDHMSLLRLKGAAVRAGSVRTMGADPVSEIAGKPKLDSVWDTLMGCSVLWRKFARCE